jgi:hypothetical protein
MGGLKFDILLTRERNPVLQTEDGIEVFPFRHFADLLADPSL